MYKLPQYRNRTLSYNKSIEGETIEQKLERVVNNKEPIKDGAPVIYTERREGVRASTNIRTDRFEIAIEATDKISKSYAARRDEKGEIKEGETQSIAGKSQDDTTATK